jgi:hypothetical protein
MIAQPVVCQLKNGVNLSLSPISGILAFSYHSGDAAFGDHWPPQQKERKQDQIDAHG